MNFTMLIILRNKNTEIIVCQMHLIDYLITLMSVCLCVCLSTDWLSNDYVRMPLRNLVVSKAIVSGTNRK